MLNLGPAPDQVLGDSFLDVDSARWEHPWFEKLNIAILVPWNHPIHCWRSLKQLGLPFPKYLGIDIKKNLINSSLKAGSMKIVYIEVLIRSPNPACRSPRPLGSCLDHLVRQLPNLHCPTFLEPMSSSVQRPYTFPCIHSLARLGEAESGCIWWVDLLKLEKVAFQGIEGVVLELANSRGEWGLIHLLVQLLLLLPLTLIPPIETFEWGQSLFQPIGISSQLSHLIVIDEVIFIQYFDSLCQTSVRKSEVYRRVISFTVPPSTPRMCKRGLKCILVRILIYALTWSSEPQLPRVYPPTPQPSRQSPTCISFIITRPFIIFESHLPSTSK